MNDQLLWYTTRARGTISPGITPVIVPFGSCLSVAVLLVWRLVAAPADPSPRRDPELRAPRG